MLTGALNNMNTNEPISIFGGTGFVLGEFHRKFSNSLVMDREALEPQTSKILYGISTTDNYNVFHNPTLDIETNLIHLVRVLEACKKKYNNNFDFTFISSWFVYGQIENDQEIKTEGSYCNPLGFYSITKFCAEKLIESYCKTFSIPFRILRLANVLGPLDGGVSKKKNALQYLILELLKNNPIDLYNNGEFYRDYIDVRDCVSAIYAAMTHGKYSVYNISNGKPYKFLDLIMYAKEYCQSISEIRAMPQTPNFHGVVQVKDIFLNNERIREAGYAPRYSIFDTLNWVIDEYKRPDFKFS